MAKFGGVSSWKPTLAASSGGLISATFRWPAATLQFDSLGNVLMLKLPQASVVVHGEDHVNFGPALGAGAVVTADFSGATTIDAPLAYVSARTAAGTSSVFEFKGDTYVYHQDATPGVDAGDALVRMVNTVGVSVANGAAVGDLHFG